MNISSARTSRSIQVQLDHCVSPRIAPSLGEKEMDRLSQLKVPVTFNERARISVLQETGLLDSEDETFYDRFTSMASRVFKVPIAYLSMVDIDRVWYKSTFGFSSRQCSRDDSFCSYTILDDSPEILMISDTHQDPRFENLPMVVGPMEIRFYAGVSIVVAGRKIGTLSVCGPETKELNVEERMNLLDMASMLAGVISERRTRTMDQECELARLTIATMCSLQLPLANAAFDCSQLQAKHAEFKAMARPLSKDTREQALLQHVDFVEDLEGSLNQLSYLMEASLTTAIATSSTLQATNHTVASGGQSPGPTLCGSCPLEVNCNVVDTYMQFQRLSQPLHDQGKGCKVRLQCDKKCPLASRLDDPTQQHRSFPSALAMTMSSVITHFSQKWRSLDISMSFEDDANWIRNQCHVKHLRRMFPTEVALKDGHNATAGRFVVSFASSSSSQFEKDEEVRKTLRLISRPLVSVGGEIKYEQSQDGSKAALQLFLPVTMVREVVMSEQSSNDDELDARLELPNKIKPSQSGKGLSSSFVTRRRSMGGSTTVPVDYDLLTAVAFLSVVSTTKGSIIAPRPQSAVKPVLTPLKVLFMESSPEVLSAATTVLKELGCQVTPASNGKIGLKLWRERTFDVVFINLLLPVVSGLEVLHMIKLFHSDGSQHNKSAVVVGMSSIATSNDKARGFDFGMHGFCSQPTDRVVLGNILSAVRADSNRRPTSAQSQKLPLSNNSDRRSRMRRLFQRTVTMVGYLARHMKKPAAN